MHRSRPSDQSLETTRTGGCGRLCSVISGNEIWTGHHFNFNFFFSYALLHASRKTLSTVKGSLIELWTHNETLFPTASSAQSFLALLDGGFLGAYAVGLYAGGVLGDRYDPAKVLGIGMFLSALMVFLFGTFTEWLHLYSKIFYASMWIGGGLIQSVGWPTEVNFY
ncbi:unnamed protein product [Enterobius vermicularis]|uniref:MFS domain-containing protein n=1 Tax=Enterobius vermicularis TaxID=51028 RepID=A0A0N4V6W2_ENTVE|nr:unnamed protein product [Enterobius vermicularis]